MCELRLYCLLYCHYVCHSSEEEAKPSGVDVVDEAAEELKGYCYIYLFIKKSYTKYVIRCSKERLKAAYNINNCINVLHTEKLITNVQYVSLQHKKLHSFLC